MLDFVRLSCTQKKDTITVKPSFVFYGVKDIMFKGGDFYAVWDETVNLWTKSFERACVLVDDCVRQMVEEKYGQDNENVNILRLDDFTNRTGLEFIKYCKSMCDNYEDLDKDIYFANDIVTKESYVTKTLPYALAKGDCSAYDELMSTLYAPEERRKIEWAIGSIITGDSKEIQKFLVFYGGPRTGKSTVLKIIGELFQGYWTTFDSKLLAKGSDFALESLKNNPLIAIEQLKIIEKLTRLCLMTQ